MDIEEIIKKLKENGIGLLYGVKDKPLGYTYKNIILSNEDIDKIKKISFEDWIKYK
jgi:hypothetical protein